MAKRGKEIALQQDVETQEEWEDMMGKEGLCVVDVYQGWSGLCSGMTSNFKKYRNDINDELLRFYCAKADTVDALEKYRGRCEPCFLFYAGGQLVAVIRGANAPLILRTITEQLAQEHKVLEGNAERKPIKDTAIDQLEARDREKEEEEEEQEGGVVKSRPGTREAKKEVSVVIIKPDAVQSGQAEAILEEMEARGIEILRKEERVLTDDEVKNVYIHLQDEPFFEELVAFMTSSPSIVLAITKGKTGENIINEFRELMGPTDIEQAKEKKPESLRAKFGSEKYMNAVHGSDSSDTAARELAFFFPDFVAPPVDGEPKVQRTLALIRPDAYKKYKDDIIVKIREAGFKIAMQKEIHLDKEQAEEFYKEHQGQEYFEELTTRMSSGPLLALGLAREDAVTGWRQMLGPTKVEEAKEQAPESLRAQFVEEGVPINMLHGSDSEETAKKEIEYFFPMEQTVAVIKPDAYGTKDEIIDKIHQSGFRIAARKETTLSREIAEEFYADHKDKEYYNDLVEHMVSGPTCFMVLSREGAVEGWRSLIGPTDPGEAKVADPDTIRGKFGKDKLQNAVHGSSTKDHAMSTITKIFEDKEEVLRLVPAVTITSVPNINPHALEEAISEQQQVNYEVAPEYRDNSETQEGQTEGQTEQEPVKEEQKADETPAEQPEETTQAEGQESEEKSEEKAKTPEPAEQQQQEEQTPTEPAQEEKPSEEQKPADEGQEAKQEEKPQEAEQKTEEPPKQEEEPKKEEEPAAPEPEQKAEEPKPEEKQEEAAPAQQEESKPEETKPEETAEKKEEKTEEAKPEEQKAE